MAYLVGVILAVAICGLGTIAGFDSDRAFYAAMTIVVASYYALFAVMGGGTQVLLYELIGVTVFLLAAVLGFRRNLWFLVAALAGHGVFDFIHGALITDPGVPAWWPPFCLAFDVIAALYLAALLARGRIQALAGGPGSGPGRR